MSGTELLKSVGVFLYALGYKYCYTTGLFTMEVFGGGAAVVSRRVTSFEHWVVDGFRRMRRSFNRLWGEARLRLRRQRERVGRIGASLRAGGKELWRGNLGAGAQLLVRALWGVGRLLAPLVKTLLNLALPVLGVLALLYTVRESAAQSYALRVHYGGEYIGYISREAVFDAATSKVLEKVEGVQLENPVSLTATFQLVPVAPGTPLLDEYALSDRMIALSDNEIQTAYGLYVDGHLIDAVPDKNAVLGLLSSLLDRYRTGDPTETLSFVRPVALREGLYPKQSVKGIGEIAAMLDREVRGETRYTVVEGDSAWAIAQKFGVPLQQLISINPGITESLLIGDEVVVERAEPYMSVKRQRIETYEEPKAFPIVIEEDATKLKGVESIVQEGEDGVDRVRAAVTYIDDMEAERNVLSRQTILEPVPQKIVVGSKLFVNGSSGAAVNRNFIYPVPGYRYVSAGFHGYYGHTGTDFVANYGMPIIASAPGTVVYSGYTAWGYGRHIIISHGDGMQTLYAHNSKNVVRVGDVVEQGQVIGYVGSTGNSTGNHCHFEVRVNGTPRNAMTYLNQ